MPALRMLRMLRHLDGHDRRLFHRWAISPATGKACQRSWIVITHAGGAIATIASVVLPLLFAPWPREIALRAAVALACSHLVVQVVKRSVGRARPQVIPMIPCPDCFSFPSGHATAALAVGLSYGVASPLLATPLVGFALVVGWSRVVLGVHYPGDVLVGQGIAALTVAGMTALG